MRWLRTTRRSRATAAEAPLLASPLALERVANRVAELEDPARSNRSQRRANTAVSASADRVARFPKALEVTRGSGERVVCCWSSRSSTARPRWRSCGTGTPSVRGTAATKAGSAARWAAGSAMRSERCTPTRRAGRSSHPSPRWQSSTAPPTSTRGSCRAESVGRPLVLHESVSSRRPWKMIFRSPIDDSSEPRRVRPPDGAPAWNRARARRVGRLVCGCWRQGLTANRAPGAAAK